MLPLTPITGVILYEFSTIKLDIITKATFETFQIPAYLHLTKSKVKCLKFAFSVNLEAFRKISAKISASAVMKKLCVRNE